MGSLLVPPLKITICTPILLEKSKNKTKPLAEVSFMQTLYALTIDISNLVAHGQTEELVWSIIQSEDLIHA